MKSLISVIVPIYNVESYLRQCLDSIINQTYDDLDIILIDDGSTDGSSEICDEYAVLDNRIRVKHKKNEGLVCARKDGIQIAKGDLIAYVDGDDWIQSDMIEKMYCVMERENVDVTICARYIDVEDKCVVARQGFPSGRYDREELVKTVFPNMITNHKFYEWGIFPNLWDKLFKKDKLSDYQLNTNEYLTMGEDAACVYPALLHVNSIYILEEPLYHYRQSNSSMVKQQKTKKAERENYGILYQSVKKEFLCEPERYQLMKQWREYLLFLMVPRAALLYDQIEELDYLYPFPKVKKGSKIIIYCAGTFGQLLYNYLEDTHFCDVVALMDQNYKEICKQGFPVVSPDEIDRYEYDHIVIANSFYYSRHAILDELSKHISKEKIHIIDEKTIMSDESLKAFHLEE